MSFIKLRPVTPIYNRRNLVSKKTTLIKSTESPCKLKAKR